jgi:hypothetical protein
LECSSGPALRVSGASCAKAAPAAKDAQMSSNVATRSGDEVLRKEGFMPEVSFGLVYLQIKLPIKRSL